MRWLFLALLLLSCRTAAPAAAPAAQPSGAPSRPRVQHLVLVGTNDVHGWLEPHVARNGVAEGGFATFAGYVDILRSHDPGRVVLLDAGDLFQGTMLSNLFEGEPVVEAYDQLGYTAAALGNHEFDYGPKGPHAVPATPAEDPFGALEANVARAHFPFLAANVLDTRTGKPPAWLPGGGTLLREVGGVKLGIVGLATPSTPSTTNPTNVQTLAFGPMAPAALAAAQGLRARGADAVVLIAHAGAHCAPGTPPDDLTSCDPRDAEILDLLRALPPGTFDAVIAGHTHQAVDKRVNGTPVIETIGLDRTFGVIDLWVDPVHHAVLPERTRVRASIPICAQVDPQTHRCDPAGVHHPLVPATFEGEPVHPDARMAALIAPWAQKVDQLSRRDTGVQLATALTRDYDAESPLGDVLADALRKATHADVSLLNGGGLRADLPAGPLTYGELYEVLPFDNTIATVTVDGVQLRALLEAAYAHGGGLFQESGLRVRLGACAGPGRLRDVRLATGAAISPKKQYRVTLPDFLARGGAGLAEVMRTLPPAQVDLGGATNVRDAILEALSGKPGSLAPPPAGRISIAPAGKPCGPRTP